MYSFGHLVSPLCFKPIFINYFCNVRFTLSQYWQSTTAFGPLCIKSLINYFINTRWAIRFYTFFALFIVSPPPFYIFYVFSTRAKFSFFKICVQTFSPEIRSLPNLWSHPHIFWWIYSRKVYFWLNLRLLTTNQRIEQ